MQIKRFFKKESGDALKRTIHSAMNGNKDGHMDQINKITFNKSNNQFLSCSNDTTLKAWNTRTGKCLMTFEGHLDHVLSCQFQSILETSKENSVKEHLGTRRKVSPRNYFLDSRSVRWSWVRDRHQNTDNGSRKNIVLQLLDWLSRFLEAIYRILRATLSTDPEYDINRSWIECGSIDCDYTWSHVLCQGLSESESQSFELDEEKTYTCLKCKGITTAELFENYLAEKFCDFQNILDMLKQSEISLVTSLDFKKTQQINKMGSKQWQLITFWRISVFNDKHIMSLLVIIAKKILNKQIKTPTKELFKS